MKNVHLSVDSTGNDALISVSIVRDELLKLQQESVEERLINSMDCGMQSNDGFYKGSIKVDDSVSLQVFEVIDNLDDAK